MSIKTLCAVVATIVICAATPAIAEQPSAEEIAFVKSFFQSLQQKSFKNNREYCGYFGFNDQDEFVATPAKKGKQDSCWPNDPGDELALFASYHTHGAFSVEADSELPSSDDLKADIEEELDGYIATPGGRIWFNDSLAGTATLLCDNNCVLSDPKFDGDLLDPTRRKYTLRQLIQRDRDLY